MKVDPSSGHIHPIENTPHTHTHKDTSNVYAKISKVVYFENSVYCDLLHISLKV